MTIWVWIGFAALVLAPDSGVLHRKTHAVTVSEAVGWTTAWVVLALLFNVGVYWLYEHHILGLGQASGLELRKCRPRNAIEDIFSKIRAARRTAGVLPQGALAWHSIMVGTKSPWARAGHSADMTRT